MTICISANIIILVTISMTNNKFGKKQVWKIIFGKEIIKNVATEK